MRKKLKLLKSGFVRQQGATDCGIACLCSIVNYYNGFVSLDQLRQVSGTSKTGTTLLGLYQAAKSLGFEVSGLQAESIDNLREIVRPVILHVTLDSRMEHYVVCYGLEGDKLLIGDPSKGLEYWSFEDLKSVWKSKALLSLSPGPDFKTTVVKNRSNQKIIEWIRADMNVLLASLFLGMLVAVFSLSTAVFAQKLIDVILPGKDFVKLVIGLILFGLVLLFKNGLGYIRSYFLISHSRDFNNRMINSFFRSLVNLPKSFFDSKRTGEMVARMNDTARIQTSITNFVGNLIIEILVVMASIIVIYVYSFRVGLLVTIFLPAYALILWRFNELILRAQKSVMSAYASNESNYIDVISGIEEVKSAGANTLFHQMTTKKYSYYQNQVFDLGKIRVRFSVLTEFLSMMLIISVISFASYMVFYEELLLGSMMAILSLSASIGPALARVAVFNIQFQEAKVALQRMEEFTELEAEKMNGEVLSSIQKIELKKVCFNYPGALGLLHDINISIEKGKITALLGESGSGKSTILQLIQRFYSPTNGAIIVDQCPIHLINMTGYRHKVGVVSQNIKVFNNYLGFNIALSDEVNDYDQMIEWSQEMGFHKFFIKFPNGYNTLLGEEGANLSGGQLQLVGLARALYKRPDVLLIDEGTASMDRDTEKFVISLLNRLKTNLVILMVTHRVQTAMDSDFVYLLENQTIVDSGEPSDVVRRDNYLNNYYSELIKPTMQS